jgi:hypothetical protein
MLDASSIALVLSIYRSERTCLLDLLAGLEPEDWARSTECPAYTVKGIATHILGDDLSLLSRQRDNAVPGLVLLADEMPTADFRALLDAFNDRWVAAARFLSTRLLIELLGLCGEWTALSYEHVDRPSDPDGAWSIGPLILGPAQQTADILTRAHKAEVVGQLVEGPRDVVGLFAAAAGKP